MIEIYSYVLFLKDSIFIIRLKSYLTEYIDIALSDLVFSSNVLLTLFSLYIFQKKINEKIHLYTRGHMCHDCTVLHGIKLSLHVDLFQGNLRFVLGKGL